MHLPYAYQAKRMFPAVFHHDRKDTDMWSAVVEQIGEMPAKPEVETEESMEAWQNEMDAYRRAISKTPEYIEFHKAKIEKGQRIEPNRKSVHWIYYS